MAESENARDTGRYWTVHLSDDERQAVLDALMDYYNNPDPRRQALSVFAYEVACALGRVLDRIPTEVTPAVRSAASASNVCQLVLTALQGSRDCLYRVAAGRVTKGAAEGQARRCNQALIELTALLNKPESNEEPASADTEV